ncbi:DEDDh family exonuclease [Uniformispora flossi]|uniref:DEDDh family exonuclease n=1 Tax=Uniformispora flossi TaxID=3390723 RepID=UPI003C2F846A
MLADLPSSPAGPAPAWPAAYPRDFAVVDVETTGLTVRDRVVSVAVLLLDAGGTVTGRWSTLVDPRRDPGPTHIHGLTREALTGQPLFAAIADDLAELLEDRVLVAHNAAFDWKMLAAEYGLLGRDMPTTARLCTLTLAKRLDLPLPDWRLASLAAYYQVRQFRAHDAEDDARVLAEVFRPALHEAARRDLPLPVTTPDRRSAARVPAQRRAPKAACAYANPGPLRDGVLVQGMRVAFTGDTRVPREELEARATAAGLHVTGSVSGKTSLLVTNDTDTGTGKNRAARERGVPVVDEAAFVAMLAGVREGARVGGAVPDGAGRATGSEAPSTAAPTAAGEATAEEAFAGTAPGETAAGAAAAAGGLAGGLVRGSVEGSAEGSGSAAGGRPDAPAPTPDAPPHTPPAAPAEQGSDAASPAARARRPGPANVLILHGRDEHGEGGRVRALVVERGHRLRVNLTPTVDVVLVLPGAAADPRTARAAALGIPCLAVDAWQAQSASPEAEAEAEAHGVTDPAACRELPRGGAHDLPGGATPGVWTLHASWRWDCGDGEVDVVAFVLGADEKVRGDDDFVFWNHLSTDDGTVSLDVMGPAEQGITVDLDRLGPAVARIAVAAVLDGGSTFDAVGAIEVQTAPHQAAAHTHSVLDAATTERVLLLGEFYRRGTGWRFRAQGQGYEFDAIALARSYGVDVEE